MRGLARSDSKSKSKSKSKKPQIHITYNQTKPFFAHRRSQQRKSREEAEIRSALESSGEDGKRAGGILKGLGSFDSVDSARFTVESTGSVGDGGLGSLESTKGMTAIEKLEVNLKKKGSVESGLGSNNTKNKGSMKGSASSGGLLPGVGKKTEAEEFKPIFTRDFSNPDDKLLLNEAMNAAKKARATEIRNSKRGRLGSGISSSGRSRVGTTASYGGNSVGM